MLILEETVFYEHFNTDETSDDTFLFQIIDSSISIIRVVFSSTQFIFMAVYFHFICETHKGDLLRHLNFYDVLPILRGETQMRERERERKMMRERKDSTTTSSTLNNMAQTLA